MGFVRSLPCVLLFLTKSMNLGHPVVSLVHGPLRPWKGEGEGSEGREKIMDGA